MALTPHAALDAKFRRTMACVGDTGIQVTQLRDDWTIGDIDMSLQSGECSLIEVTSPGKDGKMRGE